MTVHFYSCLHEASSRMGRSYPGINYKSSCGTRQHFQTSSYPDRDFPQRFNFHFVCFTLQHANSETGQQSFFFRLATHITGQKDRTSQDCVMSEPADVPIKLEHRPVFGSLPYKLPEDNTSAHQSFPILPGYRHIFFEEQRLEDMKPLPPMAVGQVGMFAPSALRSLKAAFANLKATPGQKEHLLE